LKAFTDEKKITEISDKTITLNGLHSNNITINNFVGSPLKFTIEIPTIRLLLALDSERERREALTSLKRIVEHRWNSQKKNSEDNSNLPRKWPEADFYRNSLASEDALTDFTVLDTV